MTQDRASGAAANEWGRVTAREIAAKIGAVMKGQTSNEATLNDEKIVIKCAASATDSVGVTFKMLDRLDSIIGAFQLDDESFELWSLSPEKFRQEMRDTRSKGSAAGKVGIVRKDFFEKSGRLLARIRLEACISNVNSDPVCEFYTSHPYPPPLEDLDRARDLWLDENVHRAEYHLLWPNKEYRPNLDVLVAGCGTWQGAKFALCHPAARVVGMDVSPTSLEHTEKLKQKYQLTNLETRQLPIENVDELDRRFDLIVCTGVLHHLVDPDAGLRALRSVLRPEGAMYLMVYAPYGRTGVYMLQEYCRRLGIGTSRQEINDLTAVLKELPQHHPLLSTVRGSRDSLDADSLADALLNPRDRTYSVPQLFDFIERNELMLGRWYWQAPYLPQCGSIAATPHANRLAALPEREQYLAMELWRGLMTNHDFVVHRSDMNNDGKVRFDDKRCLRYVPIRRPWTICVQERLPAGAAGVLLNQTHLFDDLFLLIDEPEKRMFEAIDGRRSILEIVEKVKEEEPAPLARVFFEKLWRYDQVVFDTSKAQ